MGRALFSLGRAQFSLALAVLLLVLIGSVVGINLPPVPDTSKDCLECRSVLKGLDVIFGNATKVEDMIITVNEKCGTHKLCATLIDGLIKIPASLFSTLEKEAWPDWGLCAFIGECKAPCCNKYSAPEQVHLSLSDSASEMRVSWVTLEGTTSNVEYGEEKHSLGKSASGVTTTYTHSGWVGVIHRVVMTGLEPGKTYFYRVGDGSKFSETFSFKTLPATGVKATTFAVLADMSYDEFSDNTVKLLTQLVDEGKIDAVIHSGDISYEDGFAPHFDAFMNKIQPIASRVPYMVTPGNHEALPFNFAPYRARFFMPGDADSMYYSWQAGGVKFVALSTETPIDTANISKDNVEFAEKTLAAVDRTQTPWVVAHFHRPLYCTGRSSCEKVCILSLSPPSFVFHRADTSRSPSLSPKDASKMRGEIEDVFYKNKVDFTFCGHEHAYQRMNPVYKSVVTPGAPVYFMQGAAGNREGQVGPFPADQPAWVANSKNEFGLGIFKVAADLKSVDWQYLEAATGAVLDQATYTHA